MEDYTPKIPNDEIRKLIKIDKNGRKYILIKEYDELVEKYNGIDN